MSRKRKSEEDKPAVEEVRPIDMKHACGLGEFVSAKEVARRIDAADITAVEKELEESKIFKQHKSGDTAFYERVR